VRFHMACRLPWRCGAVAQTAIHFFTFITFLSTSREMGWKNECSQFCGVVNIYVWLLVETYVLIVMACESMKRYIVSVKFVIPEVTVYSCIPVTEHLVLRTATMQLTCKISLSNW